MAKKKESKRSSKDIKMQKNLDKKFSDLGLGTETIGNEKVTQQNVGDSVVELMKLYGANKNLYRTIPHLISGLKPGKQRLFYTWWISEGRPMNTDPATLKKLKFIKVDKLSANTVTFHPHGTTATDELIGREGQYWNNNVMTIVPQGNYGNMRGDTPGAGRYREAKLSEFTIDCFFSDFNKYCIPMKLGYDGENYEPEYLPSKYPFVLFNPQFSGIGYGLASNIPPFNVAEVLDATIKLIKDPNAKIMLIPDSPTGCDVLDEGNFKEINKTGQSKITFRATADIDYVHNIITINTLPINSSSRDVIKKIIDLRTAKKGFDDIIEIKDYTVEGDVKINIFLKPDAKPEKVLRKLYKKNTGLKTTFPVGITVIDDYQEYEYGVKDLLKNWIEYREDDVRSMFLNTYQIMKSKQHMNEVLLMVFNKDNIDVTVNIAKTSKSRKETIDRLMKAFQITSLQASTIADMHVYNFNEDAYNGYKADKVKLKEEIEKINEYLSSDEKIGEYIIEQLEYGKKKYGRHRMSKVVKETETDDENIPDTDHLIGISESGFIKKILLKNNTSIGAIGNSNAGLTVMKVNNRENLLVIDSTGLLTKISISAIPDMEFGDNGVELRKFFSVKGDIKAVMELPTMDILNVKDESLCIIFITKNGLAKKVQISEFKKLSDSKSGISLNKDDELATALFAFNNTAKDVVIYTDKGDGIRLPIQDIRIGSATAKGSSVITLKDDEHVVGASLINPKKKLMFFITSSGRAKVTEVKYFPVMKKKGESISLITLSGNETLLGVSSVDKGDIISVYRKNGEPDTIEIKNMVVATRIAKGEKLIKTGRGDIVVAYKVFSSK